MILVFVETSGKVLSLRSLHEFYDTANRVCEEQFGITAREEATEIRLQDNPYNNYRKEVFFLVELIGAQDTDLDKAKEKWSNIGKGYNWELLKTMKTEDLPPPPIDASLSLPREWFEPFLDKRMGEQ